MIRALVLTMLFAGCVVPPSLSVDTTDAGLNSAPSIVSVRADNIEFPEYSEVTFEKGSGRIDLTVWDTDLDDILYPKIFVDYTFKNPTPPRATCSQAAGNTVARSSSCDLIGLCQDGDVGQVRTMQILVFDRQVLDVGAPAFQAMPPGGLTTSRTFTLRCQSAG